MFEEHQLRLEERLKTVSGVAARAAQRIRKRLGRLAFWDYSRVWERKEDRIPPDEVTLGSVSLHRALEDVRLMMFSEGGVDFDREPFEVRASKAEAAELARQNLLQDRTGPPEVSQREIYGPGVYSLEYFLGHWVTGILQVHGRALFRLHFETFDGLTYVTWFEHLQHEDVRRVRFGTNHGRYRCVVRDRYSRDENPPRIEYVRPDDVVVFVLEPPFAKAPGKPRLKEAQRLAKRETKLLYDASLAAAHAGASPEDHRWWVERARSLNVTRLHQEVERLGLRISSTMGSMATMSAAAWMGKTMTSFYEAYDALSFRWRVATLRESLLRQFNEQVVRRLLMRNGYQANDATVVTVRLRSSSEWSEPLEGLIEGRMTVEEAHERLFPTRDKQDPPQRHGAGDRSSEEEDSNNDAP